MDEQVSVELVAVGRQLARWRRQTGGGRGSRIPAELWRSAARVARVRGVYATAKALGLRYDGLKARVDAAGVAGASSRPTAVGEAKGRFVELHVGLPDSTGGAVVELVDARGGQMRIHLPGARAGDLVALAEAFWSRRS